MSRTYKVTRVAGWDGWCSPCQREDRPLVVTRGGPAGPLSWLAGLGDDDRCLLLTCRVCGEWQYVPAREQDDPEIVLVDDVDEQVLAFTSALVADARSLAEPVVVHDARSVAEPVLSLPVPPVLVLAGVEVAVPAPRPEEPEVALDASLALDEAIAEVDEVAGLNVAAAVAAPVLTAAVPAPRRFIPRIVTVPAAEAAPAFSPEEVAAAASVLAAARAQTQRTPSTSRRHALDRSRRARSGPTPRRAARPAAARSFRTASTPVIALPAIVARRPEPAR